MTNMTLQRLFPRRVTLSVVAAVVFILTMFCIGEWGLPAAETYDALFGLFGVLGVSIAGDTYRPSGQAVASNQAHKVLGAGGQAES